MFASIMESARSRPLEGPHDVTESNKLYKKNDENNKGKDFKTKTDNMKEKFNAVKCWETIKVQRFDPTDKNNSQKYELSTFEANRRNKSAKIAEEKLKAAEKAEEKAGKNHIDRKIKTTPAVEEENEETSAAAGFANLGELKNIFYKEVCHFLLMFMNVEI